MNKLYIAAFFIFISSVLLRFEHLHNTYLILSIFNSYIAVREIFKDDVRVFTIHKVVNLFILFFFIIANAFQYNSNSIVTSLHVKFSDFDYCIFQFWVMVILVLYNTVYSRFSNYNTVVRKYDYKLKSEPLLIAVSLIAAIIVFIHYRGDFVRLFFRGLVSDMSSYSEEMEVNVISSLLFGKIIRPIPVFCYIVGSICEISKRNKYLLFILMLLTSFPTGLARNAVAMYWLPFFIMEVPFFRKRNNFILVLMFGLLIIFPFLDNFRYFNGDISLSLSFNYFNSMNFDASQEMMYIMKNNVITYGSQLVGVVLFFIPRFIWPTKPIGSGAYIANNQGAFENISMPFWGEGFINFGYFGIIIFCIFLAIITKKIDNIFWNKRNSAVKLFHAFDGLYLLQIGCFLFLLRGDLLSSFSYLIGTIFSYYVIVKICLKQTKYYAQTTSNKRVLESLHWKDCSADR